MILEECIKVKLAIRIENNQYMKFSVAHFAIVAREVGIGRRSVRILNRRIGFSLPHRSRSDRSPEFD